MTPIEIVHAAIEGELSKLDPNTLELSAEIIAKLAAVGFRQR